MNSKKDKHKENCKAYQNQIAKDSVIKRKIFKATRKKKTHTYKGRKKIFH